MVHVEGPGGEDISPRKSGRLNDYERRAIDRFRCPTCDAPLDLLERARDDARSREPFVPDAPVEDACELMAACRQCMVTFSQEDWRVHQRAA